jgi:uncharacterized protein (DUF1330 family)
METNTIMVFLKYQDRESWCGMELLTHRGSIVFAAKKISQMQGKIREPRWDEFIVSEFQTREKFDNVLYNLAKENDIKYYRIVFIDPYSREKTRSFAKPTSLTYTDKTIVILNFLKYHKKTIDASGEKSVGKDAYKKYGRDFIKILEEVGGRLEYGGKIKSTVVEVNQPFDFTDFTFVRYPSMEKLMEMNRGMKWQTAAKNRTAGLNDTTVIRVKPYEEFL